MSKDHGCGCGCGSEETKEEVKGCCGEHGHEHQEGCEHDHEMETMEMELEDGTVINSQVLGVFECNDIEYIALLPEDSEDVYLYRYAEDGEEVILAQIESDEEYEAVGEEFMRLVNED